MTQYKRECGYVRLDRMSRCQTLRWCYPACNCYLILTSAHRFHQDRLKRAQKQQGEAVYLDFNGLSKVFAAVMAEVTIHVPVFICP